MRIFFLAFSLTILSASCINNKPINIKDQSKAENCKEPTQGQADLTKFVQVPGNANETITGIDSLSKIILNKFIAIANDAETDTYKEIQSFFEEYKSDEDSQQYIYPDTIKKEHLTIQYIDYSNNYGWVGVGADSTFNSSKLTALIFIPVFDNIRKGQIINTICFRFTLEIYSERDLETNKDYRREERIIQLKQIEIDGSTTNLMARIL